MRRTEEARAESRPFIVEALSSLLSIQAELAYNRHRLKYVHTEDDGEFLFVCVCEEAFDRSSWNHHITDSFKEIA
jgi:hypothetical protein